MSRPLRAPSTIGALGVGALFAVLVAACGGSAPSPSSLAGGTTPAQTATPSSSIQTPLGGHGSPASPPSTTRTSWGRIWDTLPKSFPRYPGSEPIETGAGPASATLAIAADAKTAADWMETALERAGYSTKARSAPLEDGSIVIDSDGTAAGCAVETTLTPHGGTTIETVMFGAVCPLG